ncbi:MAG: [protein-PII] uridylyltransferase [Polyangiales bacterium]
MEPNSPASDDERPRPSLSPSIVAATRQFLSAHRTPIRQAALRGEGGTALAAKTATLYDGLLSAFFCAAAAKCGLVGAPVALLAVGGYGRGLVALGSDLDVLVLAQDAEDPRVQELAEMLLYPLWDAGVSVGHAVRSPADLTQLARDDLRTATTVLDARVVAGDAAFAREAIDRGWRALFDGEVNQLLDAFGEEMHGRHSRFGASVFLLEPDIKHGRGALRDLDIVCWALGARFRVSSFREALQRGFVSADECERLESAKEFYWRARCAMHAISNRRADRLTYDAQEECARALGYVEGESDEAVGQGAEKLMQAYYGHARTVATTLELVLERCRTGRSSHERIPRAERIADGIERFDGALNFTDAQVLVRDTSAALRIVEHAVKSSLPLSARARESIARATSEAGFCERLRANPASGPTFLRLISHSPKARLRQRGTAVSAAEQGEGSVIAELHDLGLLLAMVPEFAPVTGRVHHDVYHVYTVDVHSVAAVDRLHEMARGEHSEAFETAARVQADVDRRAVLCLATLLHDVGKGRRGDHSAIGADLVPSIANRLGISSEDGALAAWLVRQHLALYHVATRRDLADPETIASVARLVGSEWRLRALYLLTVADLSTTSPTSMTTWKARMLDELLRRTEEMLASGVVADDASALIDRAAECAGADHAIVRALCAQLPPRYVYATPSESIVRHARALASAVQGQPFVVATPLDEGASGELVEVLVSAPDRPGLLARLSAMLYACRLDVQSAQLFARQREGGADAMDVFVVRRLDDDPGGLARLEQRLPRELERVLAGDEPPAAEASPRAVAFRRAEPAVRTEVAIDNDASGRFTVIELFCRDRPGLLHAVSYALYGLGLTIASAKVNTEGRRAADVFYVLDRDRKKLDPARFQAVREALAPVLTTSA